MTMKGKKKEDCVGGRQIEKAARYIIKQTTQTKLTR
jgi:hypothetical protein